MSVPRPTEFGLESWAAALVFWLEGFLEEYRSSGSGSGDVTGPGSSVNNNLVAFDGLTGKLLKDSGYAIGTSGAAVPVLNAANTFSGQTTFSTTASYGTVIVQYGNNGGAGPLESIHHDSATPAAYDDLWYQQVNGNSSTAVKRAMLEQFAQLVDPTNTSEDARWGWQTIVAGTKAVRWYMGAGLYAGTLWDTGAGRVNATGYDINGTSIYGTIATWSALQVFNNADQTPLSLHRTHAGATVLSLGLRIAPSGGGANGNIAQVATNFLDAAGNEFQGAFYRTTLDDATDGSEDTSIAFFTVSAGGAVSSQLILSNGAQFGSPTGGALGRGIVNAVGYYDDNVQILPIVPLTPQSASGQTNIDFSGIPANVRRVTVCFAGLSLSGSDNMLIQIGDAGGIENTGYDSMSADVDASETVVANTTGFILKTDAAADAISGSVTLTLADPATNTWVCQGVVGETGTSVILVGGRKSLSDVLTQVRIDTTGTNTFDTGAVNVVWE